MCLHEAITITAGEEHMTRYQNITIPADWPGDEVQGYSTLAPTIGSSTAAFLAGYHPKKIPVVAQTANETTQVQFV